MHPHRPYAVQVEPERTLDGRVEDMATIFLVNRECPFTCLMCDLWKYTLKDSLRPGDILRQLDAAMEHCAGARHVKLYNAGNFFDSRAIPPGDRAGIASRLKGFETVIIENHPRLCGPDTRAFAALLQGRLEVAMGLETVHPEVLPRLNKQMTAADFRHATETLRGWDIGVRAFVLLRPPWLSEHEGRVWALRSVQFAFGAGVEVCTVIPTRGGNGIMEHLQAEGTFAPPSLRSLERAQEACLQVTPPGSRLFVDLWDAQGLRACGECAGERIARMTLVNHRQQSPPPVRCTRCGGKRHA